MAKALVRKKAFKAKVDKTKKFYCLEMFPYPSGKFIWVTLEITQLRVLARYKSLQGYNVLHPMWVGILLVCLQKTQRDKII